MESFIGINTFLKYSVFLSKIGVFSWCGNNKVPITSFTIQACYNTNTFLPLWVSIQDSHAFLYQNPSL